MQSPTGSESQLVLCSLLTSHALEVLATKRPEHERDLRRIAATCDREYRFPDGSLLLEGGRSSDVLWNYLKKNELIGEGGIWQPCGYGSIAPFQRKGIDLYYTTEYREILGELSLNIVFPAILSCPTSDYSLNDLLITVGYNRQLTTNLRIRFASALRDWFQSVSQRGMFEDGPVKPASPFLEFQGRLTQFRIDASKSGQDTLNWLLLYVINFGYDVIPISDFIFDHGKQLERFLGPIRGEKERLPLSN